MYKKILVPLDGSKLAEISLPYAAVFAERLGSEITLVHVCESDDDKKNHVHGLYLDSISEEIKRTASGKLGGIKTELLIGDHAEQIVDYADNEDVGLIILATHGSSGVRRWVMGSVADKVVRAATRPVILIRAAGDVQSRGKLQKVLVPLDGSTESEAVLPHIQEIAAAVKAKVLLFHVMASLRLVYSIPGDTVQIPYTPQEIEIQREKSGDYLQKIITGFEEKGVKAEYEVAVGSPAEEIIRAARETGADLVAMSTHGRSGIGRWALGSTADKVLTAGTTPVMLVRSKRV